MTASQAAQPGRARAAQDPFSYACGRCGACCRGRPVLVNPHDMAMLAEGLGLAPAAAAKAYLQMGKPLLRAAALDGACVFFAPDAGCRVHAHRPAACRFYPLGRVVGFDGVTRWEEVAPEPDSLGRYGVDGAVGDYLHGQGAGPHLEAVERLSAFLDRALVAARRAGALGAVDALVARIWAGEAGFAPLAVLAMDAVEGDERDLATRLDRHLADLAHACGLALDALAQVRMAESPEGRACLARLVQAAGWIGASLGLSPGFSRAAQP